MSVDLLDVNLGTSIVAATYSEGVVLGADSRTSSGSYILNNDKNKVVQLYWPYIYCCTSGSVSDTQALTDIVRYYLESSAIESGVHPTVKMAAGRLKRLCYANRKVLSCSLIVAGWDNQDGASVYSIPMGGALYKEKYVMAGSGSSYMFGYADVAWKDEMTLEECEEFVARTVSIAIGRDNASGGCIRTVSVTPQGSNKRKHHLNKYVLRS